ncbi:ABC transporter permease [Embleya scabrispora]|uniref:ABC transporter permease n=1 Tax=Embleya scabrispora TaxID=159449 RepID=UPI0003744C53|nr:ABC transporter permease [Embleya scabrispora]MYS87693.1 FtsX-like permease family protein [Streptomyces sp. SID5474]
MLRTTLRGFLAHRGRLLLSGLAVLLSVAFVTGTLVLADTTTRAATDLAADGAADVTVRAPDPDSAAGLRSAAPGGPPTLSAGVLDAVRRVPGVAAAHPVIEVHNVAVAARGDQRVEGAAGGRTVAGNWLPDPGSPVRLTSGREPHGPGEVVLDAGSSRRAHLGLGDRVRIVAVPGGFEAVIVGIATFRALDPGYPAVFLDTDAARSRLLGVPDVLTSVRVDAAAGVADTELARRVATALGSGEGAQVRTRGQLAAAEGGEAGAGVDFVRTAMLGFAGVSLLVAGFLIVNTFSMLVARRTRELGLLRALGASRGQVRRSVQVEALLLATIGSTLGLAAGIGLAALLREAIGGAGVGPADAPLAITARTPIAAYLVGVPGTLLAAAVPAARASRVAPMAALREAAGPATTRPARRRTVIGAGIGAAGVLAAVVGGPLAIVGVVLSLVAVIVLGPLLVRTVIPVLTRLTGRRGAGIDRLGRENLVRDPRRTSATAAALAIGVAVVAATAVVAASASASMDARIDRTLGSDITVQSSKGDAPLTAEVVEAVRRAPGVGRVIRLREARVELVTDGGSRHAWVQGADPDLPAVLRMRSPTGVLLPAPPPGTISLGAGYAADLRLSVGGPVRLRGPAGAEATVTVGALRAPDPAGRSIGRRDAPLTDLDTLARIAPGAQEAMIFVDAAPGTGRAALKASLARALAPFPQAAARDREEYKNVVRAGIDGVLDLVYALLGLAILIAALGVVNTLTLSVLERTREIGLLRAIGTSRGQIRRMVRAESVALSAYGTLLGLLLGVGWGMTARRGLADQGLEVLAVPWSTLAVIAAGSAVVGVLAALLPARRAARIPVLTAIGAQ